MRRFPEPTAGSFNPPVTGWGRWGHRLFIFMKSSVRYCFETKASLTHFQAQLINMDKHTDTEKQDEPMEVKHIFGNHTVSWVSSPYAGRCAKPPRYSRTRRSSSRGRPCRDNTVPKTRSKALRYLQKGSSLARSLLRGRKDGTRPEEKRLLGSFTILAYLKF